MWHVYDVTIVKNCTIQHNYRKVIYEIQHSMILRFLSHHESAVKSQWSASYPFANLTQSVILPSQWSGYYLYIKFPQHILVNNNTNNSYFLLAMHSNFHFGHGATADVPPTDFFFFNFEQSNTRLNLPCVKNITTYFIQKYLSLSYC